MLLGEPLVVLSLLILVIADLGILSFPSLPVFLSLLSLVVLWKALRGVVRAVRDLRRLRDLPLINRGFFDGPWRPLIPLTLSFWVAALVIVWNWRWVHDPVSTVHGAMPMRDRTLLHAFVLLELLRTLWKRPRVRLAIRKFLEVSPLRTFFAGYAAMGALGTLLLILPTSLSREGSLSLIDGLFLSVSALAVTGLTPVTVAQELSLFGQSVILFLIQLGGLGIVTVGAAIAAITGRRLSLSHTLATADIQGSPTISDLNRFILRVFASTFVLELIGWALLWFFLPADLERRWFHALFHSVSAFCNAGFSSFAGNLDIPGLSLFKSVIAILVVLGGIGFPILFEAWDRGFHKQARTRPWTPSTVLTLLVTAVLLLGGWIGLTLTESWEAQSPLSWFKRVGQAAFYSVSARTAGFNLMPVEGLTLGSQLLLMGLMVIGGSPLSTAGGIKTTTFGVLACAARSSLRGHNWVQFSRSEISFVTLLECVAICSIYAMLAFASLLVLLPFESVPPLTLFFEILSALSTVGLSLGATSELTTFGKLWICGLMLAGRFGIVAIVYVGLGRVREQRFRYAERVYYVG